MTKLLKRGLHEELATKSAQRFDPTKALLLVSLCIPVEVTYFLRQGETLIEFWNVLTRKVMLLGLFMMCAVVVDLHLLRMFNPKKVDETNALTAQFSDFCWEFTSMSIHPDGLILGTGTSSGTVRIWDIKSQQVPATFEQHTGTITSLAFSENGYRSRRSFVNPPLTLTQLFYGYYSFR